MSDKNFELRPNKIESQGYNINYNLGVMNDHIKNILINISQHPVTNVISSSGTGKTTQLPVGIAEANNRIVVVVSNSSVASSLSSHVKSITNKTVSDTLNKGSNNKANNISNNKADITYISEKDMKEYIYIMFNQKSKYRCLDLDFTDVLMIDQADIGSTDQYLIMALWKHCAINYGRVPRLLLVSNQEISLSLFDIEYYTINTNYYPSEIRYSNRNYPVVGDNYMLMTDVSKLVYDLHTSSLDGDMLIFTTDKYQTESLIQMLHRLQMENVNIYPAHSELSQEEIDMIYSNGSERKIIVSDRTAETTFTINGLSIIIDLMMDHRKELSLSGGQRYKKRYITKAQATQRSERGGRDGSVVTYRMITEELFNKLQETIEDEIYRVPLHLIMLELIENNIDPLMVIGDEFDNMKKMYSLMTRLELIDSLGNITDIGSFIKIIPYGIRQAVALWTWLDNKYPPYPAITILSMIDSLGKSYYVYPYREGRSNAEHNLELLEHRKEYFEPFSGPSDVHTYAYIWNTMMEEVNGADASNADIKNWCENNYILYENISEAMTLNKIVLGGLDRYEYSHDSISDRYDESQEDATIEIGPYDPDNLMALLGPILAQVYHDKRLILDGSDNNVVKVLYNDGNMNNYKIDSMYGINTIDMDKPVIIYGLMSSVISSEYTSDFTTVICSLVVT